MTKHDQPSYRRFSTTSLPTSHGDFMTTVYRDASGTEQVALSMGLSPKEIESQSISSDKITDLKPPLVRIHSACFTSEVLGSLKCDCREQLECAMHAIRSEGRGLVIYLFQEGRGIGLGAKIQAYALQERGRDTVDANIELGYDEDARSYEAAFDILQDFGITHLRLLTNNPEKLHALVTQGGFHVEREPIEVGFNSINEGYLITKRDRMGHLLQDLS